VQGGTIDLTARAEQAFDTTSVLLASGVIAGPLFLVVALVDGATRAGYDPMSMPISLLAVGDGGWLQTINFLVAGVLFSLFAAGVYSALRELGAPSMLGPLLIAVMAVGLLAAGLFTTDPGAGFPPGVRPPREATAHATLHDVASLLVFPTLVVCCLYFALWFYRLGRRGWSAYSAVSSLILATAFGTMLAGYNGNEAIFPIAGLAQRIFLVVGWGWLAIFGLYLLRSRTAD
jgi:hypothetical protein